MSSTSSKESTKKKAPKGVVVQSRYKKAAETFSSQSSHSKDSTKKIEKGDFSVLSEISCISKKRREPSVKSISTKKLTSTPALLGLCPLPVMDQSSIVLPDSSTYIPPKEQASLAHKDHRSPAPKEQESLAPKEETKKEQEKKQICDEQEWNLLYAQYLQTKLLESMALKALEERYKTALDKIHEVWHLLLNLLGKHKNVEGHLAFITYITLLHEHSNKQKQMLSITLEVIPKMESQYRSITKALSTAKSKLEMKDVVLPDEGFQNEIVEVIESINDFMNKVIMSVESVDRLVLTAMQMDDVANQASELQTEMSRAFLWLHEAHEKVLSETSLQLS